MPEDTKKKKDAEKEEEKAEAKKTEKTERAEKEKKAKETVEKKQPEKKEKAHKGESKAAEKEVEKAEKETDTAEKQQPKMIIGVVLVLVVLGLAIAWYGGSAIYDKITGLPDEALTEEEEQEEEVATDIQRKVDGVIVEREKANPVIACVMIENAASASVRPQAGLLNASVVYEVIVEGGITRFMALFANDAEHEVGPVRSARDTYLEFASEYDCMYTHAGGSFTAMQAIPRFEMRDMDGLREPAYFWRKSDRAAPHNLFTSRTLLRDAISGHGWDLEEPPTFEPWLFATEEQLEEDLDELVPEEYLPLTEDQLTVTTTLEDGTEETTTVTDENAKTKLSILFGGSYNVEYVYNADTGLYERYNGGVLQVDASVGETLTTRNIVVQHVGSGQSIEGKGRINWPVTGSGDVDIYHSGRKYSGKWMKEARTSRTKYYFEDGGEIPLAPGTTWVDIVPPHITVSDE